MGEGSAYTYTADDVGVNDVGSLMDEVWLLVSSSDKLGMVTQSSETTIRIQFPDGGEYILAGRQTVEHAE